MKTIRNFTLLFFAITLFHFQCMPPTTNKTTKAVSTNTKALTPITTIQQSTSITALSKELTIKDIALTPSMIPSVKKALWEKYKTEVLNDAIRKAEHQNKSIPFNGKTMRYAYEKVGEKPTNGYPLYIALHGGGGAPTGLNDSQWDQMKRFYLGSVEQGIYLAARGITDTWNLHFVAESYPLYDRLIENMILFEGVDPNRIYIMGYSAGGDGVYQIATRMADRFAGANMSAGHPNGVSLKNLYHTPFLIQVGELDEAYNRNVISVNYSQKLADLKQQYPNGYDHNIFVHWNRTHSYVQDHSGKNSTSEIIANPYEWAKNKATKKQTRRNTDAIAWMSQHTRNPLPSHLIWDYTTRAAMRSGIAKNGTNLWETTQRPQLFYWLNAGTIAQSSGTKFIDIQIDKNQNSIKINQMNTYLKILVNSQMLNLSKPIMVQTATTEKVVTVKPSMALMVASLLDRGDFNFIFEGSIEVAVKNGVIEIW